ncbi:MAG: M3 family oligoendopeptidase [Rhizobiaceae bacterium]
MNMFVEKQSVKQANAGVSETGANATNSLDTLPTWKLSDLYGGPDSAELSRDLNKCVRETKVFEAKWKGTLKGESQAAGAGNLAAAIKEYEGIEDLMGRVMSYAGLLYAQDSSNPVHTKLYGDCQEKLTGAASHLLFFALEFNQINDEDLDKAYPLNPKLAHYRPWIEDLRMEKPYQLDERTEQVFLEKSTTGAAAWNRLFNETMTSLRFEVGGETLPVEQTLNMLQDRDREKRKEASLALAKTFKENLRTFTLITNTLAKDKEISDRWRGFEDIADSRHLSNRVEREVVDALNESVRKAYPRLSHRYYKMKAKWLGLDVLESWDRNAPLPTSPKAQIDWATARDMVLRAYNGFAPQMADIAREFFDKQWIDAAARPGKSPGAFAHPTVPSVHPYVLINYQGRPRDVMTLAHELGHGVHQVLAGRQGPLMSATPLTLAETASVFGEMLTFRSLLNETKDAGERKAMLAQKVEDMINTVVRQIAFYQFERKLHTERKMGELTSDRIGELWLEVQTDSLGPAVRFAEGYETFWCYIPHFIHSPFYVYAYAFGDCLVNSLYAVYQNAEQGFQDKYFEMLKAGGTKHHSVLLAPFGLDATDPGFWDKGLSVIEGLIDELEAMG